MIFSQQQHAVFAAVAKGDHNIIIVAPAGGGKTTVIVTAMQYVPKSVDAILQPDIVFLAFNKNIAETLKSRCPRHVLCSTFHALGFRALKESGSVARNVRVDGSKCKKFVWNATDRDDPDVQSIIRLIDVAKGEWPVDFGNVEWWNGIIRRHDFLFDQPRKAVEVAASVILEGLKDRDVIDFNDMLFLPVFENVSFSPRDWIFVDEAQDLNGVQHEIVGRLCRKNVSKPDADGNIPEFVSRLVAVGDPHQAIYGFRGAHADSMQRLAERFSCRTYPLSVSYRCPKAVVREAQRYLK